MKILFPKLLTSIATAGLAITSATPALSQTTDMESSTISLTFNQPLFIDIANVSPVMIQDPMQNMPASGFDDFCVGGTFGNYGITFTNPMGSAFFLMPTLGSQPLPYSVIFYSVIGGAGQFATPGNTLPNNTVQDTMCDPTVLNTRFEVEIAFADWQGREAEAPFNGTLLIMVEGQ
ncbi:hypothetical protein [Microbulbifer variabilis]|uniref:hypothetical protein n=1 Tax=Microbulbifer variabilis TaxID=266805 RepID=UPI001CFD55DC|nr:hypothetical protein [Microbulbifer variabilis]